MVMKISLILSFFFHIILLLGFQKAFPSLWSESETRTYKVELIRPPVEDLKIEDFPDANTAHIKQGKTSPPQNDEATISLNTKDKRYVSYTKIIKERLMRNWRYPPRAREYLIEGKLLLIFSLARKGNITQIKILGSSGHEILDEEAIRAVNAAAPFPSFPEHITVSRLNIKANFDYRLTARR